MRADDCSYLRNRVADVPNVWRSQRRECEQILADETHMRSSLTTYAEIGRPCSTEMIAEMQAVLGPLFRSTPKMLVC